MIYFYSINPETFFFSIKKWKNLFQGNEKGKLLNERERKKHQELPLRLYVCINIPSFVQMTCVKRISRIRRVFCVHTRGIFLGKWKGKRTKSCSLWLFSELFFIPFIDFSSYTLSLSLLIYEKKIIISVQHPQKYSKVALMTA